MTTTDTIDHRLSVLKERLNQIQQAQEELLKQVHPELRQDFCMARADRMRALIDEEEQNQWLLVTWTG